MHSFSHFGMSHNPFDKHSLKVKEYFNSKDHREMVSRLDYLKDLRGVAVFTAAPGMGKSFALRCFHASINTNLYHMLYLCLSTVTVADFYKDFATTLGLDSHGSKSKLFREIQNRIYHMYKEKKRPLILAIDEAQYLNPAILRDLKMLMNFQYDSVNCFSLVLIGEPTLNFTLEKPVNEALKQRVMTHYHFRGLDSDEVSEYVMYKLSLAGGAREIVGADAMIALNSHCQGNPRIIDTTMTHALIIAIQQEKLSIDAETIMASIHMQTLG